MMPVSTIFAANGVVGAVSGGHRGARWRSRSRGRSSPRARRALVAVGRDAVVEARAAQRERRAEQHALHEELPHRVEGEQIEQHPAIALQRDEETLEVALQRRAMMIATAIEAPA